MEMVKTPIIYVQGDLVKLLSDSEKSKKIFWFYSYSGYPDLPLSLSFLELRQPLTFAASQLIAINLINQIIGIVQLSHESKKCDVTTLGHPQDMSYCRSIIAPVRKLTIVLRLMAAIIGYFYLSTGS